MDQDGSLQGKVAVVTGGAQGSGAAVAPGLIDTEINQIVDQCTGVGQRGLGPGEYLAG